MILELAVTAQDLIAVWWILIVGDWWVALGLWFGGFSGGDYLFLRLGRLC